MREQHFEPDVSLGSIILTPNKLGAGIARPPFGFLKCHCVGSGLTLFRSDTIETKSPKYWGCRDNKTWILLENGKNKKVSLPVRLAPDRLALDKSWLLRSRPMKSTLERFTFAPSTLGRVAPADKSKTDWRPAYFRYIKQKCNNTANKEINNKCGDTRQLYTLNDIYAGSLACKYMTWA